MMYDVFTRATKGTLLATAGLVGALSLAACSSSTGSGDHVGAGMAGRSAVSSDMPGMDGSASSGVRGAPAAGPHNAADVTFATDMIPHHAQAITMADLATKGATTAGVRGLAVAIKAAQAPEIQRMSSWLSGWRQPAPATTHRMGSMGGMSMPGMMSDHDMALLQNAHGVSFDRMWLTMMVVHHRGAVTMSNTELASGENPAAKSLARSIIATQNAQIRQMRSLSTHLPH